MNFKLLVNNARGHAATYALLFIPAALTLSTLAVDVSGWNAKRDYLQTQADRIALQAAGLLPNRSAAEAFIAQAGAGLPDVTVRALLDPDPRAERIGVELSGSFASSFDFFTSAGQRRTFSSTKQSWAKVAPVDYVLILADGRSLRPGLETNPSTGALQPAAVWGEEQDWPASTYFSGVYSPEVSEGSLWTQSEWNELWNSGAYQRWATESCFNPALSPLKYAAMTLYDALAFGSSNRIGVTLTPGTDVGPGYFVLRHVRGSETANGASYFQNQIGGYLPSGDNSASAHWVPYVDAQTLLGTENCLLLSHPDYETSGRYSLPSSTLSVDKAASSCAQLDGAAWGVRHEPFNHLSACYPTERLSVREAIYWDAAKRPQPAFDAEPKFVPAIQQALSDLVNVPDIALLEGEKTVRGNTHAIAPRKIVVLTDLLPSGADLSPLLENLRNTKTELVLASFHHEFLNSTDETALETRAAEIRLLEEQGVLRLFELTSVEELNRFTSRMLNYGRQIVLEK